MRSHTTPQAAHCLRAVRLVVAIALFSLLALTAPPSYADRGKAPDRRALPAQAKAPAAPPRSPQAEAHRPPPPPQAAATSPGAGPATSTPPAARTAPRAAKKAAAATETAAVEAPGKRVVVCKYVRKPGVAEILHHIIIVNEQALLGRGFAGAFPFPFSDAHFNSVAIRFAKPSEAAEEVALAECPAPEEPPPAECPDPDAENCPEVPPERPPGVTVPEPQLPPLVPGTMPGNPGVGPANPALPHAGAPQLGALTAAGLLALAVGLALAIAGLRRSSHSRP